ncbi:MAG: methionine ABC transporter substrate-binding protein [Spirochaetaceae bacterium]|nr:methionine ABC transporter substrate-binding protein [Spirochaetaceae bacterium]
MKTIALLCIAGMMSWAAPSSVQAAPRKEPEIEKKPGVLTVGAIGALQMELLNLVKDDLAAQEIALRVIEFSDYTAPNSALIAERIDANYYQSLPHLEADPAWRDGLSPAFGVHLEPMGLYAQGIKSLDALKDGTEIAIPRDSSGKGRALLLLQAHGVITLTSGAGLKADLPDIAENPKNLKFREFRETPSLDSLAGGILSGNAAVSAGLDPRKDALILEGPDSRYVHWVVVRKGDESDYRIQALEAALRSQKVQDRINTWPGLVAP